MNSTYAGIDLHKDHSYVTVTGDEGQILGETVLDSKVEQIVDYLHRFGKPEVVFEATRNWYWLYDALQREGFKLKMAHPKKTKAIGEAKIKTDKIDSHMLAHLLRADLIPESYLAPLETRHLRELLRHRVFLVRERAKVKSKIRTLLSKLNLTCVASDITSSKAVRWLRDKQMDMPDVFSDKLDDFLSLASDLNAIIGTIEVKVEGLADSDEVVKLLITIPGIGKFSALLVKAEIGDIDRFPSANHLTSYCGLVPSVYSSGNHTHRGPITKEGNKWLRWVLVEASWKSKRKSKHLADFYNRIEERKNTKVAKVATARKLAVAIYYIWTRREPFKEPRMR